jgi:chromosome segregation ATPase
VINEPQAANNNEIGSAAARQLVDDLVMNSWMDGRMHLIKESAYSEFCRGALMSYIYALENKADKLETTGIAEIAAYNTSVADYMEHWEKRATEAEKLNEQWEQKAMNWFASPAAREQLEGYRDMGRIAADAENERDAIVRVYEKDRVEAERTIDWANHKIDQLEEIVETKEALYQDLLAKHERLKENCPKDTHGVPITQDFHNTAMTMLNELRDDRDAWQHDYEMTIEKLRLIVARIDRASVGMPNYNDIANAIRELLP